MRSLSKNPLPSLCLSVSVVPFVLPVWVNFPSSLNEGPLSVVSFSEPLFTEGSMDLSLVPTRRVSQSIVTRFQVEEIVKGHRVDVPKEPTLSQYRPGRKIENGSRTCRYKM